MKKPQSPYRPREWAVKLHGCGKRWMIIVAHRRAGKTTAALNYLIRSACMKPGSRYAFIAPTYKQAKEVAWELLKRYSAFVPGVIFMESELSVTFPGGSKITLYGTSNPHSLRGLGFHGVVFDEYSQQPSNVFTEVVRPMLAEHKGYGIWIGTPKGRNEFFELYTKAKDDPEWFVALLTVNDTGIIGAEELESARKVMSEDEYLQEWHCSFDASLKGAYYAKELGLMRASGRIGNVPHDPSIKVHTVWDLGIHDATAVGFYQKKNLELRKIDYLEVTGVSLADTISMVRQKNYVYGKHFAPHDIEVRELTHGKSRREIARSLGIDFCIVPNISIEEGINAARMLMPRLWVDAEKCKQWLEAISQYQKEWVDSAGMFKEKPLHNWTSNAADEFRYAALVEGIMSDERKKATTWIPEFRRNTPLSWLKRDRRNSL